MIAWIFAKEEYTGLYHRYFSEFISEWFKNGKDLIDSISAMISPYAEKGPMKFCTYEEFETGVSTLKEFSLLRAESIDGQLNGRIGSTSGAQQSDELIDAGDVQGEFPTDSDGQTPRINGNPSGAGLQSVAGQSENPASTWIWTTASAGVLTAGIAFALVFRRRK